MKLTIRPYFKTGNWMVHASFEHAEREVLAEFKRWMDERQIRLEVQRPSHREMLRWTVLKDDSSALVELKLRWG